MNSTLLIYGANGAIGRRLAELAIEGGLTPIVAGRRADRIDELASRLGCEGRTAGIDEVSGIMADVNVVASCVASYTAHGKPILRAAIEGGANYLDLTGETRFVRWMFDTCNEPARQRGVTLVPSAGLGLCSAIAARAAIDGLPTPVERVTVAYGSGGMRASQGTAQSMVDVLAGGAVVVASGRPRTLCPGLRLGRTPLGVGTLFPLTEPLMFRTMWPQADMASYLVPPGTPILAPVAATVLAVAHLGARAKGDWLRRMAGRAAARNRPGGGFRIAVRAEAHGVKSDAVVDLDDVYEVSSRAMLEVAQALAAGTDTGVRASGAVVAGAPAGIADRIGVRLSTTVALNQP